MSVATTMMETASCLITARNVYTARAFPIFLLYQWFRVAVFPLDGALYAEIIQNQDNVKRCAVYGTAFIPKFKREKYCTDCAVRMHRKQEAERQRKRYLRSM